MKSIDENTKIPMRLVWALVVTVGSGAFWITSMYINIASAQADVKQLRNDIIDNVTEDTKRDQRYIEVLHRIDKRLERIEDHMGIHPRGE